MTLADTKYGVRELKQKDLPQIQTLLGRAKPWDAFLIRPHADGFADFGGWWYGALAEGTELEALMCIENHRALCYAHNRPAARAMAETLAKQQEILGGGGGGSTRHELHGESRTIDDLWRIMQHIPGRKLHSDRFQQVMRFDTAPDKAPSKRLKMAFGKPADLRLVYEFLGEYMVEKRGLDPRRLSPRRHKGQCEALITAKRLLLGRDGDKPVFLATLRDIGDDIVLLDQVYVPLPFRSRKRLIGASLYHARKAPLARGKTLVVLTDDETFKAAAVMAGYAHEQIYRQVVAIG